MPAGSTYTPIATTTLGSAATSYTFSSIPSIYTDLLLVTNYTCAANTSVEIVLNSDSGNNYSFTVLEGNGSVARSGREANVPVIFVTGYWAQLQTGNRCQTITQLQNYSNTSTFKTVLSRGSVAPQWTDTSVALWRSTSAISTLLFRTNNGANFAAGSTFTLYGIASA